MAQQRQRRSVNHMSLTLAAGSITVDGQTFQGRSVQYARTEYDDGTCEEAGLPPGMKPRPEMSDLFAYVFGGEQQAAPKPRKVKRK